MSQESTTPDLVELTRGAFEAGTRHDLDAALSFYVSRTGFHGHRVWWVRQLLIGS